MGMMRDEEKRNRQLDRVATSRELGRALAVLVAGAGTLLGLLLFDAFSGLEQCAVVCCVALYGDGWTSVVWISLSLSGKKDDRESQRDGDKTFR